MKLASSRIWVTAVVCGAAVLFLVVAYLVFRRPSAPIPPPPVLVSVCNDPAPGMHRIGFGIRFDVPEIGFAIDPGTIHGWTDSLLPLTQTIKVWNSGASALKIALGPLPFENELESTWPVFSEHVEVRDVHYISGPGVSKDRWGYLKSGERWRLVKFVGSEEVGYLPTSEKLARLYDQIISSACFSPRPSP